MIQLQDIFQILKSYAGENNISEDLLCDNRLKNLLIAEKCNIKLSESRMGNDAHDNDFKEYELKTLDIARVSGGRNGGFTTNHHLNQSIVDKYRKVAWIFSVWHRMDLIEIYKVEPEDLDVYFSRWEDKLKTKPHINNPKIGLGHVKKYGKIIPK